MVVPPNKRMILAEKAAERKTTAITFQDFVNVVSTHKLIASKAQPKTRD